MNLSWLFTREGKEEIHTLKLDMDVYNGPAGDWELKEKKPLFLRIRNLGERKLELHGKAEFVLMIPCDRCLELVRVPMEFDIDRILDLRETGDGCEEELEEQPYLNGYHLEVDQFVCNELILNLPMKVLCSSACKGICNRCGTNLNHENCGCDTGPKDPRMAAIQDIFKQFKEV